MSTCKVHDSGAVELYFYGELEGADRQSMQAHLAACRECRHALEQLTIIRAALEARPDVSAPPANDWSGFMAGLDRAVRPERRAQDSTVASAAPPAAVARRRSYAAWGAMAALLALVTTSVLFVARSRDDAGRNARLNATIDAGLKPGSPYVPDAARAEQGPDPALAALSEEHFERSKLVVLGLATKDAETPNEDWNYERELASSLLNDTRLYRLAAEERGMNTLAGVLRDLEIVLLQTSLSESDDPAALAQIQRLIRKRDLVGKMEVVSTAGI